MSFGRTEIEEAYRLHGHVVLRRARKILGDEDQAKEVLQEVFVSLVDRPHQFRGDSSILTWLYSATTHSALNRLRTRRTRDRILAAQGVGEPSQPALDRAVDARRILMRVSDELAQVAVYYYFDQMTHAEISEVLGCSRRQVGKLLERFHEAASKLERDPARVVGAAR
ncbi:MAG: sigma-70 family RNA polymerase sigma factor [Deltaproteobacteria bacterium]|nr:sigma-70 family RNA polymerase sigma factor [Deltaproteobacteria bacterium]